MVEEISVEAAPALNTVPFVLSFRALSSPCWRVHDGWYFVVYLTTTRAFIKRRVFVHFCGYRRERDLQRQIENQFEADDCLIFCLSVDICLQKERSDLSDEKNLACGGRIEWLLARFLELQGGAQLQQWSAARVLSPWPPHSTTPNVPILPALTAHHWAQVRIGSTLIWFLLRLLLHAAGLGLCGFMEHPSHYLD